MTMYLRQILELLAYFTNYWLGRGTLVKGLSLLDMHGYVLVEDVKLLAYLKPSFGLNWVLWRWIVVYLHACLFTYYLGWELLPTWLRTICTCCRLWS